MSNDTTQQTFEEVFVSPFAKSSKNDALAILSEIRKSHSIQDGWIELEGYVEEFLPGQFTAIRHHMQYR